jgi:hypothetical protein
MSAANLETMSAAKLLAAIAKAEALETKASKALIAVGRGAETFFDTEARVAAGNDPLGSDYLKAFRALHTLYDEQRARRRWHGSDKPIKRRS